MKIITAACILLLAFGAGAQKLPQVDSGNLLHLADFPSKFVAPRNVDVWLPEGYDGKKRFAVLYMHDGQMLFDSTATWNRLSWNADEVIARLRKERKLKDFIIVGIWNTGLGRHPEYLPGKIYSGMSAVDRDTVLAQLQRSAGLTFEFKPRSDDYLKFIVQELKPYIDAHFRVYKDRKHTFIAGSSMGGLISLYAICEYPRVFGGAASLSTHWPGSFVRDNNPFPAACLKYLEQHLPKPAGHRLYFDCGDQTLDAWYPAAQKKVDDLMQSKGFDGDNWMTRYFPGKAHSERDWGERLDIPLLFLLGK